jgi:DNA-binding protein YbaB
MFDKLKQLKELKDLQDSMSKEKLEFEKNGIKVILNGKMEIEELTIPDGLNKEDEAKKIKECINDAMKKVQMSMASKMSGLMNF